MKNIKPLIINTLVFTTLASCQKMTSNPLEDYKGLRSGPVTGQQSPEQTIVKPALFNVTLEGTNKENTGNFVEGVASDVALKVSLNSSSILDYAIELVDFPLADRPALNATNTANVFKLAWRPPAGTIAPGAAGRPLEAIVRITVTNAKDHRLIGNSNTKALNLMVSKTSSQPKLVGTSDLSKGADEGVDTALSVDIEDPNAAGNPGLPTIQVTPYIYSNTEAYRADGSQYVVLDYKKPNNPEKRSDTTWRYHYLLKVSELPLDRDREGNEVPAATSVDICFHLRAVSAAGTMSGVQQVCTKARYAAQPPQFELVNADQVAISASTENTLTVRISTPHILSTVTVANPNTQIANLSGKKEMKCALEIPEQKNALLCVISWTPTCVKADTKTTLKLKAESALGTKTKANSFAKELTILANPAACTPTPTTGANP